MAAALAAPVARAAFGETRTFLSQPYVGDGGDALKGYVDLPEDLDLASDGTIYVADTMNNVVRLVKTDSTLATLAGTGAFGRVDGIAGTARFGMPEGIAVASDRTVYVSDTGNDALRQVTPSGTVSTLLTNLSMPRGLALAGDVLYIADYGSNAIKRYRISTGELTTLTADVKAPRKIAVSPDGNTLYAVDNGNYRIVKVNTSSGAVSLIAGSTQGYREGTGSAAQFYDPAGIGLDASTNTLYVGDTHPDRTPLIRTIDLATNTTTLWVYDRRMMSVNERSSMRVRSGYLYLVGNGTINRFTIADPTDNGRIAGADRYMLREGPRAQALIARPIRMLFSRDRRYLYITGGHRVVRIDGQADTLEYLIGTAVDDYVEGTGTAARFSGVGGVAINADGATLYVADRYNNRIRTINVAARTSAWLSGIGETNSTGPGNGYAEGAATAAKFATPADLVLSADGATLYVADTGNHRIRAVDVATGATSLVAGSAAGFADGTGASAKFNGPYGLALDATGQNLYVADRNNHVLRKVRLSDGKVTTLAGNGRAGYRDAIGRDAVLNLPTYLALDGDRLFFTDAGSHRIRLLELTTNVVKTTAGSGNRGYLDGPRLTVDFNNLGGLLADSAGETLYVGDTWNDVIRSVDISGEAPFTDAKPTVSAVVPRQVRNVGGFAQIDVRGSGFKHGIKVWFGSMIVTSFVESSTKLAVKVPAEKMANGRYDVRVKNLDGQVGERADAFWLADRSDRVPADTFALPSQSGFQAFPGTVRTGATGAVGDLDGDGVAELLAGSGPGAAPSIRVLRSDGTLLRTLRPLPSSLRGGINVAVGDLDGDGTPEIATVFDQGSNLLRVITPAGKVLLTTYPFGKSGKQGGTLAIGDVTGDGQADLVVAPATGGGTVSIWNLTGKKVGSVNLFPRSKSGVSIALADINGDGVSDVLGVPRTGRVTLRAFDAAGNKLLTSFAAFPRSVKTGATIAAGDLDADGKPEIVVGLRPGGKPFVRVFSATGTLQRAFLAFSSRSRSGVGVAVGPVTSDGVNKIMATALTGAPEVVVYTGAGRAVR